MEKGRLGIAFLVLSLVTVGFTSQSAFGGATMSISIDDVSMVEGNAGTTDFVFTVSAVCEGPCETFSVGYSTEADTATDGDDYNGVTDELVTLVPSGDNFATGTIIIPVNGDTDFEFDEIFFVNIFDCSFFCPITNPQGQGNILNDDDVSSPDDVFVVMGACCSEDPPQDGSLASADLDTGILT